MRKTIATQYAFDRENDGTSTILCDWKRLIKFLFERAVTIHLNCYSFKKLP